MLHVYGVSPSPYVRKVLTCLDLKGLPYKQTMIMPMATPEEYDQISPLRKIPAITDGDVTLCDSSVICEYLQDAYPDIATMPDNAADKARARWLEEYADSKLSEVASGLYFETVLKPFLMKEESDLEKVKQLKQEKIPAQLDYLETQVPEQGFLFGEQPMTADIALITHFINAGYAGFEIDAARWPHFSAYMQRIITLPLMEKRLAHEAELLAQLTAS